MTLIASAIVHKSGAAAVNSLKDIVSSCVFDLDATKSASYGGSGQTWANLVSAPADGSSQSAYDFVLGDTNAVTTDDPTFTGSAGSSSAYFALDGGDYFDIASGANTNFLRDMHKTTGGSDLWFAIAFRYVDGGSQNTLFGTQAGSGVGMRVYVASSGDQVNVVQRGGSSSTVSGGTALTDGADHLVVISHSHGGNNTRIWVNTTTKTNVSQTFSTTTSDAANALSVAANGTHGALLANTTRIYAVAMGNAYIDDAEVALIAAEYNSRHGRSYA